MKLHLIPEIRGLFPPLASHEFQELKGSIQVDGLKEKIKVLPDGGIIDGEHRWKALGVEEVADEQVQIYDVTIQEAVGLAIKMNYQRRNMSIDQRKEFEKKRREMGLQFRREGLTQEQVAKILGVSPRTIDSWESAINGSTVLPTSHKSQWYYRIFEFLKTKQNNCCVYCGRKTDLVIDHVTPLSKGGTDRVDNLVLACQPCNSSKGDKTAKEFGHPEVQNTSNFIHEETCIQDCRVSVPKKEHTKIMERLDNGETQEQIAADYGITQERVSQIKIEVESKGEKPKSVETPAMPDKLYKCLTIDPPYPVEKIEREERPKQGKYLSYPTMSLDEIAKLPIQKLADETGCHVYLWVTQKHLPDGLKLFEIWGVKYQCLLTWVKPTGITPFSWMYNTEHVLFGRIGSLSLLKNGVKLSFEAPVKKGTHSTKPDTFYDIVRAVSPEPRLDMFSRRKIEGFDVWGNEANG